MKYKNIFFLILISLASLNLFADETMSMSPDGIYGKDDRYESYAYPDAQVREMSKATAARILNFKFDISGDQYTLKFKESLSKQSGVCPTERFADQPEVAWCTGFLIADDILVTAGHCVSNAQECNYYSWVFDFALKNPQQTDFTFSKDQVYKCTKILALSQDYDTKQDYAVLKLDRKVVGRNPLKLNLTGQLATNTTYTVMGYSSGLPLKIADKAVLRDSSDPNFFVINSDTFHGNSGSPVIDAKSGLVEGLLTQGGVDYERVGGSTCYTTVVNPENGGEGEKVTRISIIPELKKILGVK